MRPQKRRLRMKPWSEASKAKARSEGSKRRLGAKAQNEGSESRLRVKPQIQASRWSQKMKSKMKPEGWKPIYAWPGSWWLLVTWVIESPHSFVKWFVSLPRRFEICVSCALCWGRGIVDPPRLSAYTEYCSLIKYRSKSIELITLHRGGQWQAIILAVPAFSIQPP